MEKSPKYNSFENLQRKERVDKIKESGLLDNKRFSLSHNPEVKKILSGLQKLIEELKDQYPEVISFGISGSMVKGYATSESDIDGFLFIDRDLAKVANPNSGDKDMQLRNKFNHILKEKILNSLSLKEEQLLHTHVLLIDKKGLKNQSEKYFEFFNIPDYLELVFLLSIGSTDIRQYRKIVLDSLENQGEKGEQKLQSLMKGLQRYERREIDEDDEPEKYKNSNLYPQTIKKAKEYFL